jgi:hypothetical protein
VCVCWLLCMCLSFVCCEGQGLGERHQNHELFAMISYGYFSESRLTVNRPCFVFFVAMMQSLRCCSIFGLCDMRLIGMSKEVM